MSTPATRYGFDKNWKPLPSGSVLPEGYYEDYDADGNLIKKGTADAYMRPLQRDFNTPASSTEVDQGVGTSRSAPTRSAGARVLEGRRIRESEERMANLRQARQDKLDEANTYHASQKNRVGARAPKPDMSEADMDKYIKSAESRNSHTLNPVDVAREQKARDYQAERAEVHKAFLEKPDKIRLRASIHLLNLNEGDGKGKKPPSWKERQRRKIEGIRDELKKEKGESISVKDAIPTDPRIKTPARPVAKFDYGDGKKVPLKKDSKIDKYRGEDGIARDTPEDVNADEHAAFMRNNMSEQERIGHARRRWNEEASLRRRKGNELSEALFRQSNLRKERSMPGYNPSRQELDSINAARAQRGEAIEAENRQKSQMASKAKAEADAYRRWHLAGRG